MPPTRGPHTWGLPGAYKAFTHDVKGAILVFQNRE